MFETARNFVKAHKKEFIAGGLIGGITGAVVGGVTAYVAYKAGYDDSSLDVMKQVSEMFPNLITACGYEGIRATLEAIKEQHPDAYDLLEGKSVDVKYLESPFGKELIERINELYRMLRG